MDRGLLVQNLLCAGLALAGLLGLLALLHLVERATGRYLAHQLGWRAVLATGWLGVPLHELSHLAAAAIFRHRIVAYSLFDPDPVTGTLGYVRHAYRRRSAWQLLGTFFIGVAPAVAGGLAIAAVGAWMLPPTDRAELLARLAQLPDQATHGGAELALALGALARELVVRTWQARSWLFPLQLYLLVCIASHLAPSRSDLLGALPGGLLATALAAGAVVAASAAGASLVALPVLLAPVATLVLLVALLQLSYVAMVALLASLRTTNGTPRMRRVG